MINLSKYCRNDNIKDVDNNKVYIIQLPIQIDNEVLSYYLTDDFWAYRDMVQDIPNALQKPARHKLLISRDDNSCLRYCSINGDILSAHFRSQNQIMRKYDSQFLAYVAQQAGCNYCINVTVDEYLIIGD